METNNDLESNTDSTQTSDTSPKSETGSFFESNTEKIGLAIISALLIIVVSLVANFLTQQNEQNAEPETENEAIDTVDEDSILTYTNSRLPDFSFEYDSSIWDLSEEETISEDDLLSSEIALTNTAGTNLYINLSSFFVGGFGPASCVSHTSRFDAAVSTDIYRLDLSGINVLFPADSGTEQFSNEGMYNYIYTSSYIANGTEEFNNLLEAFTPPPTNADACINLEFLTDTNIENPFQDDFGGGDTATGYFTIGLMVETETNEDTIRELELVDEIVGSIER